MNITLRLRLKGDAMSDSTKTKPVKPDKPYGDFPLFPHATRRWAKKIRGKLHYFGPWDDPQGALDKYLEQKDDLYAGRTPRPTGVNGCQIRDLVNHFLSAKRQLVETGELTSRSFSDYYRTGENIVTAFGRTRMVEDLTADDFQALRSRLAKTRGPVSLGNEIQRVRIVFKHAFDAGLIDRPVRSAPTSKGRPNGSSDKHGMPTNNECSKPKNFER